MTNLKDDLAELAKLDGAIASSEAYLLHARGRDRRTEQRYLAKLRRQRKELADSLNPHVSTTGEAGMVARAGAA